MTVYLHHHYHIIIMPVELLEDVLVIQVDEDAEAALQLVIYIRLGESLTGLSQ